MPIGNVASCTLKAMNKPYPRTCSVCKLGPCRYVKDMSAEKPTDTDIDKLKQENERLWDIVNQCRLAFAGYVSVRSAVDMIDNMPNKGETGDETQG